MAYVYVYIVGILKLLVLVRWHLYICLSFSTISLSLPRQFWQQLLCKLYRQYIPQEICRPSLWGIVLMVLFYLLWWFYPLLGCFIVSWLGDVYNACGVRFHVYRWSMACLFNVSRCIYNDFGMSFVVSYEVYKDSLLRREPATSCKLSEFLCHYMVSLWFVEWLVRSVGTKTIQKTLQGPKCIFSQGCICKGMYFNTFYA